MSQQQQQQQGKNDIFENGGGSLDIDIPPSQPQAEKVAPAHEQPGGQQTPPGITAMDNGPRATHPLGVSPVPAPTIAPPAQQSRFLNQQEPPAQAPPPEAAPARVEQKADPTTSRVPRQLDFVLVCIGPGKYRPAIVTNAIEGRPEVIDATIFLVPALDGGQTFAAAHNVQHDPTGQTLDTWRWRQ